MRLVIQRQIDLFLLRFLVSIVYLLQALICVITLGIVELDMAEWAAGHVNHYHAHHQRRGPIMINLKAEEEEHGYW